jgi:signal transduction histidine kinase
VRDAGRVHLRRTVRLRLTALYGALFCACGAALLAITYLLVRHFSTHVQQLVHHGPRSSTRSSGAPGASLPPLPSLAQLQVRAQAALVNQHDSDLHQLVVWSLVAFAVMAVVSIVLGWLMAGRLLRPLRTMAATTQRISHDNLHERLALQGPRDELKALGDTIDDLLARLEAAFEAQRRFVANAAHELRTPLARMRTALDVAVGQPRQVSSQVTVLDHKLREGLDRAEQLVDGFLALGRAEHGELLDRAPVALDKEIAAILAERAPALAAKRIVVDHDLDAVTVCGSPTLLARMFENVIDNAIHHNVPGGWMRIELDDQSDRARLTVDSGGRPLDPNRVAELGQPFRRLGAERTGSGRGAGLGLSIVAAIVDAHVGTLKLEALREGGLRVAIEFPSDCSTERTGATP